MRFSSFIKRVRFDFIFEFTEIKREPYNQFTGKSNSLKTNGRSYILDTTSY